MTGPFAKVAVEYSEMGLHPFPCGGEDGKKPLVKNWPNKRKVETVRKFADRFPSANVGIPTGANTGLTVVDVDDRTLAGEMLKACGETPLMVGTPRGGFHLYYRYNGEKTLKGLNGALVDIRGAGGQVLAPPSLRTEVGVYESLTGGYDGFDLLPTVSAGSLPLIAGSAIALGKRTVVEGERNNALFAHCRTIGRDCPDEDTLVRRAIEFAADCQPPYPVKSAMATAKQVWKYVEEGRCYAPGGKETYAHLSSAELDLLHGEADARSLLADLKRLHGCRRKSFALVPEKSEGVFGMNRRRIRAAREKLVKVSLLIRVHQGGRGKGDPALFKLKQAGIRERGV